MWVRGDAANYDDWARKTGDERWSYEKLLPYFRRMETHDDGGGDRRQHGFSGPIHSTCGKKSYPLQKDIYNAFVETGHKAVVDANSGQPLGIAKRTKNWRDNVRKPTGAAYGLDKVQIPTSSLARRVIFSAGSPPQATGVALVPGEIIHAEKEVIVACGALRSPQLLMLSGIGDPTSL